MGAKPSCPKSVVPPGIPKLESSTDVLPPSYRHLGGFPVLAKQARTLHQHPPNLRVTQFLREHLDQAALIADFLSVRDRTTFLVTHKVQLPPKLLKVLLFGGPSRETNFLYCTSTSTLTTSDALLQQQCYQAEIRYRGSFLCRAVPLPVLAHTLHRVLRGWLSHQLRKYSFQDIQAMVHKLIAAFKPTEQVWHAVVNNHGEDGATLLTYAVATNVPMPMIQKLLEIPCFDLGLPDQRFRLTPIQLAKHLQREDILRLFASLAGPEAVWANHTPSGSAKQCYWV